MSSTAEVPTEDAAGEWGKNPASKVEKKPAPEKDKQGRTAESVSTLCWERSSSVARDVLAIQASTVASESSFSAGGRIISDHRTRLKSDTVEGLLCLQDWLNANDTKPINKDAEEEVYLEFHQASKCHKEGRTRSRSSVPSSSPLSSPASSSSLSPSISSDQGRI